MSVLELAEAIRSRRISSQEVIEAHLRRIEAVNPSVNAVTVVLGEQALAAAKAADRAVAAGGALPPFHGVPFTIKGNIDLVGTPTTQGLKALSGAYPSRDAPVVERLKAAGAIPIGRTDLAALAVRWHCESELWGTTVNPWDRSRTPGASSGGEAAALATGMSPLGLGNEALLRKRQGCDKLNGILRTERNCFYGYYHTVQMAPLPGRDYFAVRPLVFAVSAQLPRFGGDDARARIAYRSHHDLPLSCNATHPNWRSAADRISKPRTTRGASMKPM